MVISSGKCDFPGNATFLQNLYHFLRFCLGFHREHTIFLRIPCHFLRLFLVFRRENTIFLRLLCYFLRFSDGKHTLPRSFPQRKCDFPDNTIFLQNLYHFLRFRLVFPRENTLRIPCHFLRLCFIIRRPNTIFLFRAISLGFQKENIRYLGYFLGKMRFSWQRYFLTKSLSFP